MAYNTVGEVLGQVRVLLQDKDPDAYRYSNDDLIQSLNEGLLEARRIRPDLYRGRLNLVPQYTTADLTKPIAFEAMYRPALVNYVAGRIQLQDDEATNDARASIFMQNFTTKLLGLA